LRAEALAAGNLQSTPQQVVTVASAPVGVAASNVPPPIVIEPVNPDVYNVPVYDPAVAYGAWGYPDYPPFYWSPPGFVASNVVSFAAGVAVGAAIWGGCDWWNHNVIINVNRFNIFNHTNINVTNDTWIHDPAHRHGVPYQNADLTRRFGTANEAAAREEFRDHADIDRNDVFRDHIDVQHPDAAHGIAGDRDVDARRITPALPDRLGSGGDRRVDRPMPERQEFARPRTEAWPQAMRSRAQAFRPQRRAFGGDFHFGGGGRRRL
jgi:hypothetical protein